MNWLFNQSLCASCVVVCVSHVGNRCLNDSRLIGDDVSILVVAVEMGDPVVCTLVLVRDIFLSLSLYHYQSLSLAFYFGSTLVSATDREEHIQCLQIEKIECLK